MELTGIVRSLTLVTEAAGSRQAFTLVLSDGREVKSESPATPDPLQEGDRALLTGDFDTEGVLQAVSVQRVPVPAPVQPRVPIPVEPPKLSFGRIFASALLSFLVAGSLLIAVYLKEKQQKGDNTLGPILLMALACPLLGPVLSLVFARLFGGSLRTGRVWLAPLFYLVMVLLGFLVLLENAKTGFH